MIHVDAHSAFGTFDYPNDEKQAKLTLLLSALMALWHCMQTEAAGRVMLSPGSGFGWHILHCNFTVTVCS